MSGIKFIKQNAVIDLKLGSGFIDRIQKLFLYLVNELTKEQLEEYKKLVDQNLPLTEEWMENIATLTTLLKEIEKKADEQGFTYETELDKLSSVNIEEEKPSEE